MMTPRRNGATAEPRAFNFAGLTGLAYRTCRPWSWAWLAILVAMGMIPVAASAQVISAGHSHSLVLRNDGTVVGWGNNSDGQANGAAAGGGNVAIVGGYFHSLALKNDGTVVGWGYNGFLGNANGAAAGAGNVAIAAGYQHSLALKNDGTVVGWGVTVPVKPTALRPAAATWRLPPDRTTAWP